MAKLFASLLVTLLSSQPEAPRGPLELDETTVLHAAMGLTPGFDFRAQARAVLAATRTDWDALDAGERKAAVEASARALRARVDAIGDATRWRLGGFVRLSRYDPATRELTVTPLVRELHPLGWVAPRDPEQLAPGFQLIVPNHRRQRTVTLTAEAAEAHGRLLVPGRRLYLSVDLALLALQQGRNFQAPIVAARYDLDGPNEGHLAAWVSDLEPGAIARAGLLREGLSLDLVPGHHLDLPGGRLLDPLTTDVAGRRCSERGRFEEHLAVRCEAAVSLSGVQTVLEQIYVGGRLAESAYRVRVPPPARALRRFDRFLAQVLDRPGDARSWESPSGWRVRYAPERLASSGDGAGPLLVVTAVRPGFRFERERLAPRGAAAP